MIGRNSFLGLVLMAVTMLVPDDYSSARAASLETLKKFQSMQVIPLESHALLLEDHTAFMGSKVANLGLIPRSDISKQRGWLVVGTLMMLAEANSPERQERESAASAQAEEILKGKGLWSPNVELAKEVAKQLSAVGLNATVSEQTRSLPPLQDFGTSNTAGLRRANAWYADTDATDRYRSSGINSSTAVMEVGLGNYGIGVGTFYIRVLLKVFEPQSGKFLGRARQFEHYDRIGREDLWSNDGAGFKERFAQLTRTAVAGALRDIGVEPK